MPVVLDARYLSRSDKQTVANGIWSICSAQEGGRSLETTAIHNQTGTWARHCSVRKPSWAKTPVPIFRHMTLCSATSLVPEILDTTDPLGHGPTGGRYKYLTPVRISPPPHPAKIKINPARIALRKKITPSSPYACLAMHHRRLAVRRVIVAARLVHGKARFRHVVRRPTKTARNRRPRSIDCFLPQFE